MSPGSRAGDKEVNNKWGIIIINGKGACVPLLWGGHPGTCVGGYHRLYGVWGDEQRTVPYVIRCVIIFVRIVRIHEGKHWSTDARVSPY